MHSRSHVVSYIIYKSYEILSFQCLFLATVACDVTHPRPVTGSVYMETEPVISHLRLASHVTGMQRMLID